VGCSVTWRDSVLGSYFEECAMGNRKPALDTTTATEALRATLKSQYHAALAMLQQAIDLCPDDAWSSSEHVNSPWQVAYHTLFFAHLYMQPSEADFSPWEHHQAQTQFPDGLAGPADPDSTLPLLPEPYTRAQVLAYWSVCDQMVDDAVDALDVLSPESGFSWYKVSKLEHQIINIRHIQHGAAQIADRLRSLADIGIDWVGARRSGEPRAAV
jgi:hypothetical protein